jgi:methylmalonyl-CoA/ethylmalonyl-CoA epimerase
MILRLHHIGYAVQDISTYFHGFYKPLFPSAELGELYEDPVQKVRIGFVSGPPGPLIELIQPLTAESPVAAIIGSARGGIYHVCYEVEDLDVELRRFRRQRCLPIGRPVGAVAFGGRRIVFLMSPQRDLIELVEAEVPA